jgi:hypothetical protein
MEAIDKALAAIDAHELGDELCYQKYADKYGVKRVTLSRRHQGLQAPRTSKAINQRLLHPQQELELVRYIETLSKRALPPTRAMIQNFASDLGGRRASDSWVTRFLMHTRGILWKLGHIIPPYRFKQGACSSYKQPSQRRFYRHGLSPYQKSRLRELCRVLNYREA